MRKSEAKSIMASDFISRGEPRTAGAEEGVATKNSVRAEIIAFSGFGWLPAIPMKALLLVLLSALRSCVQRRASLRAENLALRHQIGVLQRGRKQARLNSADRILWVWLSCLWSDWSAAFPRAASDSACRKWQSD
jgi:hypothetical protein